MVSFGIQVTKFQEEKSSESGSGGWKVKTSRKWGKQGSGPERWPCWLWTRCIGSQALLSGGGGGPPANVPGTMGNGHGEHREAVCWPSGSLKWPACAVKLLEVYNHLWFPMCVPYWRPVGFETNLWGGESMFSFISQVGLFSAPWDVSTGPTFRLFSFLCNCEGLFLQRKAMCPSAVRSAPTWGDAEFQSGTVVPVLPLTHQKNVYPDCAAGCGNAFRAPPGFPASFPIRFPAAWKPLALWTHSSKPWMIQSKALPLPAANLPDSGQCPHSRRQAQLPAGIPLTHSTTEMRLGKYNYFKKSGERRHKGRIRKR